MANQKSIRKLFSLLAVAGTIFGLGWNMLTPQPLPSIGILLMISSFLYLFYECFASDWVQQNIPSMLQILFGVLIISAFVGVIYKPSIQYLISKKPTNDGDLQPQPQKPSAVVHFPRFEITSLKLKETPVLTAYCENTGSGTAYEGVAIGTVTVVDVDPPNYLSPAKTDLLYRSWPHSRTLGVSTIPTGKCNMDYRLVGDKLTRELKKQLDHGTKVILWFGYSAWRDDHGKFKYEQCSWRTSDGQWSICKNHNGVSPFVEPSLEIKNRIQKWAQDTGYPVEDVSSQFPNYIFAVHLVFGSGISVIVRQPNDRDQYLLVGSSVKIADPKQRRIFNRLTEGQRFDLLSAVTIEMNRLSVECKVNPTADDIVELQKTLSISSLTDETLLDNLQKLQSAVVLAELVIERGLDRHE
jgi:hypothetical protein